MKTMSDFLTVKEAAAFLGVAENTIRNWDRDGRIPVFRHPINNYRLLKKEDLIEILRLINNSGEYPSGWAKRTSKSRKPR